MKKPISLALSLIMLLTLLPAAVFTAFASSAKEATMLFYQTFESNCTYTDMKTAKYGIATVISAEDDNKIMEITGETGTTTVLPSTVTEIPSDKYTITFDMRAVSPNSPITVIVNNPYHAEKEGFANGISLAITPATFASKDSSGVYSIVDDAWYTYTIDVDVSKLGDTVIAANKASGDAFITLSRKNRDTGALDASFVINGSFTSYGARFGFGNSYIQGGYPAPDGISFDTAKTNMRWASDCTAINSSVDASAYANLCYQIDNVKVEYIATESGDDTTDTDETETPETEAPGGDETIGGDLTITEGAITNIFMQLGGDITKRNFTWFSTSSETGYITYAKSADMVSGNFPADATKIAATRDHTGVSLKAGYYNNKATITVEPGVEYCYQLSNGTDGSKIYTFTVGEATDSFSFAFITDPQIKGTTQSEVDSVALRWGWTLEQLATNETFDGIDFVLSAGDQINTDTSNPNYTANEMQYDGFFEHEEIPELAMTSLIGNHDSWAQGGHYQHFNEPNYITDTATGKYYGQTKCSSAGLDGADYWFTYNSILFVVLNTNDMGTSGAAPLARATAKAAADKHIEFIDKVLELNKDNADIDWKIIVYHQSPYGSSYHNTFNFDTGSKYPERVQQYTRGEQHIFIDMREYLLPGIYDRDFDVVLSGHDHSYTRTHILKHEATNTNGLYYGNETITPYESDGISNYYTYEDGTTTPTFVDYTDVNGVVHKNKQVASKPVKVTNPDGLLHITGSCSAGAGAANAYHHPSAAVTLTGKTPNRQAIRIDVTPTTLTFTNYGIGDSYNNYANLDEHILDTFTIERKTVEATEPVAELTFADKASYGALAADQRLVLIDANGANDTVYTLTYGEGDTEAFYYSSLYDKYVAIVDASMSEAYLNSILSKKDGTAPEILYNGDVNCNGKITAADAALITAMFTYSKSYNDIYRLRADVNGDGQVTIADILKVLRIAVGLE